MARERALEGEEQAVDVAAPAAISGALAGPLRGGAGPGLTPAAALALQRTAGNRATVTMIGGPAPHGHAPAAGRRVLARQALVGNVHVQEVPDEYHTRRVDVNGSTVLTIDLLEGGVVGMRYRYEPAEGPAFSILRLYVHAPIGAVVLVTKSFRETLDAAADRWGLYVEQDSRGDIEGHTSSLPTLQEQHSEPPPPAEETDPVRPMHPVQPVVTRPRARTPAGPPPPPKPSRADTVVQHLRAGDWDTDDLAAQLDDADLAAFSPADRVALIAEIGSGVLVGDEDETTIDRLLEMTPTSEYDTVAGLLLARPGLLETLDDAIDGDEYTRYLEALTPILLGDPGPGGLFAAVQRAPELPWTGTGVHPEKATYQVEWIAGGRIRIKSWRGVVGMQMQVSPIQLGPRDLVVVRFMYDDVDAHAKAGEFRAMPAAAFVGLVNMQFRRDAWLAVNVALVFGGVGELTAGAAGLARALALLDIAINAANVGIDLYRAQIAASERGLAFLRAWDTLQLMIGLYGLARVAMRVPQAIRNARSLWAAARGAALEHGSVTAVNELEQKLVRVDKSLGEAEQEARAHPGGGDGAGAVPARAGAGDIPSAPEGGGARRRSRSRRRREGCV